MFGTWIPRKKFELIDTKKIDKKVLNHKVIY